MTLQQVQKWKRLRAELARTKAELDKVTADRDRLRKALYKETFCETCQNTGIMGGSCEYCEDAGYNMKYCGQCHGAGEWTAECAECEGRKASCRDAETFAVLVSCTAALSAPEPKPEAPKCGECGGVGKTPKHTQHYWECPKCNGTGRAQ